MATPKTEAERLMALWPKPLPPGVEFRRYSQPRQLNLTVLAPAEKRRWWEIIKREQPAVAALLQEEPLRALVDAFGADVMVDLEALERGEH